MAEIYQIISAVLIIAAVIYYIYSGRKNKTCESVPWKVLSVFQILLCGWFFALCVSDVLDYPHSFSYERLIVNICYAVAFLAITIYTLFLRSKESGKYLKGVIGTYILLAAVQCFVFPYGTEDVVLRTLELLEGIVIFGLLIVILIKLEDVSLTASCLLIATALELIVAVRNVLMPFAAIAADLQAVDIPLNHLSLFMRPVLYASLTLAYRLRTERRDGTGWISPENPLHKLLQVFIRPYTAGAKLVGERDVVPSVFAVCLHVLSSGTFFYLLVSRTDGLIQRLVVWLEGGAGNLLQSLTETVSGFLQDTVVHWIGTIPAVGEFFQEPAGALVDEGVSSLSANLSAYVTAFFQDLARALRLPSLLSFGISALIVAVLIMVLTLMVWAFLKITKHRWRGFRHAFCLSAIRSTVTIPFAVVSGLLVLINPLWGIILFALAIFWSMGHVYTTILAGADETSGNRGAAWFPPVLILMYLLTAAVMISIIVLAGVTLYHQIADMADVYVEAVTALWTKGL